MKAIAAPAPCSSAGSKRIAALRNLNACIRFLGSLDGCHVVTVEYLNRADGGLQPVQQAMVDFTARNAASARRASSMSLYALWMADPNPSEARSRRPAGQSLPLHRLRADHQSSQLPLQLRPTDNDFLVAALCATTEALTAWADGARVDVA
jgi:xanthine dehydrogenase small subunit